MTSPRCKGAEPWSTASRREAIYPERQRGSRRGHRQALRHRAARSGFGPRLRVRPEGTGHRARPIATKKLGLSSEAADAGVKAAALKMKATARKSRVTFYYLVAEATGTLSKLA